MTFIPNDYGEMKLTDNTTATSISSQNSWVKVTGFSAGQVDGISVSSSDLVVGQRGNYYIDASGAATPVSTNTNFEFGMFTNDSLVSKSKAPVRLGTSEAQPFIVSSIITNLSGSDTVSLRVRNLDGTSNITVNDSSVVILQI